MNFVTHMLIELAKLREYQLVRPRDGAHENVWSRHGKSRGYESREKKSNYGWNLNRLNACFVRKCINMNKSACYKSLAFSPVVMSRKIYGETPKRISIIGWWMLSNEFAKVVNCTWFMYKRINENSYKRWCIEETLIFCTNIYLRY